MRMFKSAASVAAMFAVLAAGQAAAATTIVSGGGASGPHARYAVIRRLPSNVRETRAVTSAVPSWTFSYTYRTHKFNETFVGTPVSSNTSTVVPVVLVPVKLVVGGTGYDPTVVQQNGVSIVQNVLNSPVFASNVDFTAGSIDLGTTQYLDAFQRGNLWGQVKNNPNYHVLLGNDPASTLTVAPVQVINVPTGKGKISSAFGVPNAVLANIDWLDPILIGLISKLNIPANALPLFITTQTYLYSGASASTGCCIGGYHSATTGGQAYSHATYITTAGQFAEDVSALSHEIGEWIDDPTTTNPVPQKCTTTGGQGTASLEVGDPLEGRPAFGTFPTTVGGVTWHLQDLVWLKYFGAPATTSANGWSSYKNATIAFCSAGG